MNDKKIWYGLAAAGAVVFLACANPTGAGNNSGAVSPAPATTAPIEPEITLAEFDQLQEGMTYDQVVTIVGVNGQVESEYKADKPEYSSKSYSFVGPTKGFMTSNAYLYFTGGKLSTKMQHGLS
jgi:hypothetical protein